eukprot:scaffold46327_cov30-Phaeocystis_antarctica.AAC.1
MPAGERWCPGVGWRGARRPHGSNPPHTPSGACACARRHSCRGRAPRCWWRGRGTRAYCARGGGATRHTHPPCQSPTRRSSAA